MNPGVPEGPASEPSRQEGVPPLVVLAEDDPHMRTLLKGALEREGFAVTAVCDGLELMDSIRDLVASTGEPDLIVSDVQMPRCTGLVALATLRKMNLLVPAVLITAFGDDEMHAQAMRLGAAILDKPFDIYKFRSLASELVRR